MKPAKIVSLCLTAWASLSLPVLAIDSKSGTNGAVFLKIPTSARVQALGDTGVSLVEGSEAMGINAAGIASTQLKEAGFSYLSWLQGYAGQRLSYVHPVGQSVLGVNVAYYGIDGFDARDEDGRPQYSSHVKVKNGYASVALAKAFFLEKFLLGFGVKGVMEDNYTQEYKNLVFDGGVILKLGRRFSFGWSGQNYSGKKDQVVKMQRLGGALTLNPFLTFTFESKSYSDGKSRTGGGCEFNLPEEVLQVGRVSFRAGYTAANSFGESFDPQLENLGLADVSGWAFGFGIYSSQALGYGMGLDYAFVPYGALGKASQIALKFQF